jgi:hypothetical protein
MRTRVDAVGRFDVTWRTDAVPDADVRARLGALSRSLIERGLPAGLLPAARPDELVCVRRVELPVHRMHWSGSDAELVADWGRTAARAVSDAVAAGGPDVVRYRSTGHARRGLVAGLLRGDRSREWAWRAVGVWPGAGPASAADAPAALVLAEVLATAVRDEPYAGVGLVAELARAGLLPRFATTVAGPAIVLSAARGWQCTTGMPWPPAGLTAAALPGGPAGRDAYGGNGSGAAPGFAEGSPAGPVAARSVVVRALRGVPVEGRGPDGAAAALAALAVLELDPGLAVGPDAGRLVGELAALLAGGHPRPVSGDGDTPADRDGAGPRPAASLQREQAADLAAETGTHGPGSTGHGAGRADPGTPRPPAVGSSIESATAAATASTASDPGPVSLDSPEPGYAAAMVPAGRTRWGGLLFLLPLVAATGLPYAIGADPDRFGAELRPVLHDLGLRILRRAADGPTGAEVDGQDGAAGTGPEPTDPAVLAFAGLPPDAAPPATPPGAAGLESVADAVVDLLRTRLAPRPEVNPDPDPNPDPNPNPNPEPLPDPDPDPAVLLSRVCRRSAVIEADPGWIDVGLELDEVDVDVRRAGLDLDPGHLPWLGCVVRFRYG